ncbi:hypothetical protein CAEBREN_00359 [Caenorhabditis brenneri]|uniref:C-type lectin domain-containing protein n=1 Tax=Caenorhabditis brenneri TaxID=135651 RepID=G0NCJ6_CAEBE|nr:hypothetical protein CAEBREN_00359 [Caenorhabditis brenneri]
MIVTNGTPFNFQNYSILFLSWDECLAHCLKTDNCMVVYTDRPGYFCQFFKIGNLRLVKRSNNTAMRIGFKIRENNRSAVCPVDDTKGEGYSFDDYSHRTQRYYNSYTFIDREKTELWMFTSSGRHGCPTVFHKMFMRPAGPWCIGTWGARSCLTHSEAVAHCASVKNSVLSGLDSLDEWNFVNAVSSSSAWMGGTRKESCIGKTTCKGLNAFDFVDPTLSKNPTGFSWHSQKPNGKGEDCLVITTRNGKKRIEDILCTSTSPPGCTKCFEDVVCGAYPLLGAF